MSLEHIIESWRDEEYRESLDTETRALLPANPAGEIELTDADLLEVDGGTGSAVTVSASAVSVVSGVSLTIVSVVSLVTVVTYSIHEHCVSPGPSN